MIRPQTVSRQTRVVIVEDQEAIAALVQEVLTDAGYDARRAPSPRRAAAFAAEVVPAVIVLDVMMAELDGWRVLDQLRADPVTHLTPVLITSAVYDRPGLRALPPGGPVRYVPKPFDVGDLLQSVAALAAAEGGGA